MGRPREFDETVVLDAAMNRFWAQGYEATSVRDLAASMGITGASLYNAFGDKRSLYRRALDHYVEHSVRDRISCLGAPPPVAAIQAFFDEIIERSVGDAERRGCLLVNAAMEVAPYDAEFRAAVFQEVESIREFFYACVAAGQRDGTITASASAEALAALLLSTLLGLRIMARIQRQQDVLDAPVKAVLGLLKTPAAPLLEGAAKRARTARPAGR